MKGQTKILFFLVITLFCLEVNEAKISDSLKVNLSHGGGVIGRYLTSFRGRGIRAFMGIPYAEPPVGKLRFLDPVPKKSWDGFIETVSNEVICPQINFLEMSEKALGKEDCLYLDVYVPQFPATKDPLPVMVFFHGGGWAFGSASFYEPDFFLDHDVILVTGNYRLGALGFLTTNTTHSTGNFGLKDMVEILKWVQGNIGAFGGNRDQVTIFGESAGAVSVTYLMELASNRGLFHRAISQSGNHFDPWALLETSTAIERTEKFAKALECSLEDPNKWEALVECLRGKSVDDLIKFSNVLNVWGSIPLVKFPPVIEYDRTGGLIPHDPKNIKDNPSHEIPLMIGINHDEGVLQSAAIVGMPELMNELETKWEKLLPLVLSYDKFDKEKQREITNLTTYFYYKGAPDRSPFFPIECLTYFTDMCGDFTFFKGFNEFLRNRLSSKSVADTYVYQFAHKGEGTFLDFIFGHSDNKYGVSHSDDLLYLFPLLQKKQFKTAPSKEDLLVQETFVKLWVNFATVGKPTPVGSLDFEWKPASKFPLDYLRIGKYKKPNNVTLIGMEKDLWPERAEFLKNIF
ncbi:juvenile hormone esterase-like [Lutzomyia longipalpis]|uniref:juvenile hormone esterase-like n=1 Tax=Lutzomyia longipalpis TaxID=7200 RepID=UPI00248335DC|nr:juvenile hormone esterase-like [Lutzomyia longipalpis]